MDPSDRDLHPLPRRRFLCCAASAAALLAAGDARALPFVAAACDAPPLPPAARELVGRAFDGIDPGALVDMHCHLLGNGDSGSGCFLHPSLSSGPHPLERLRRRAILRAACVADDAPSVDRAYVARLATLAAGFPAGARWLLFAFDAAHDDAGAPDRGHTTLHVPDAHAEAVAGAHAARFGWVASIHPYRADADAALARAAARGAAAVKWLPSAMNIDLRDPRTLAFGERAARLRLPLVVHGGEEKAVPGARRHALVNPLHVRALLGRGVRVIVAHCASLGHAADEDRRSAPPVPAFDLFERLMAERAHEGLLLGDLSAVFQVNREPAVWRRLLAHDDWHGRLLHGSDYPLPAIRPLVSVSRLAMAGLLPPDRVEPLVALREHNPLLFDFVLKRTVASGAERLPASAFHTAAHFARGAAAGAPVTPRDTPGLAPRHPRQTL